MTESSTTASDANQLEELLSRVPEQSISAPAAAEEAYQRRREIEVLEDSRRLSGSTPELEERLRQLRFEDEHYRAMAGEPTVPRDPPPASAVVSTTAAAANDDGIASAAHSGAAPEPKRTLAETIAHMKAARFEHLDRAAWEPFHVAAAGMTDEQVVARLKKLMNTFIGAKPDPRDFIRSRAEEFALHIVLNERMRIAPAFRPYRRATKPPKTEWIDPWIVGDRTVIDLHWYHTLGVLNPKGDLAELLDAGDFTLAKASAVARCKMSLDDKADEAGLSEPDQLLGTMFRTRRIRGRWTTIEGRLKALRRTLLDLSRIERYRLDSAAIEQLEHAACALFIARGEASVAAKIVVHVGGTRTSPQKMRDHKKRLGRFKCAPGGWGEGSGDDKEAGGSDAGGATSPENPVAPGT